MQDSCQRRQAENFDLVVMDIAGKRFLVIGGAGFIGSHVVDLLLAEEAKQVLIYDNFSRGTSANLRNALHDPRAEVFADGGDILHRDLLGKVMEGMDGVFHLAALWLLHCHEYPRAAFEVNVEGTMNVAECAIAAGVRRIVFSSSASVYGEPREEPVGEDHPFLCQEFYGASKVCGEHLLRALSNRYSGTEKQFEYLGLRYMNVYGPRQDERGAYTGVVTRMLNALDRGEPPVIHGDGAQAYDFIDVRDCARANLAAMRSERSDRFYNVGTGIKTSIGEMAALLIKLLCVPVQPTHIAGERPFVRNRVGCPRRAADELGFVAAI
ncbi:MAG: NAD-dependent epimerase/dehydratase family protein, partial [Burkholderiaceae bacterium]